MGRSITTMKFLQAVLPLLLLGPSLASAQQSSLAHSPVPAAAAETSAAVQDLQRDLRRIIAAPGWSSDEYGVLVVSLERGDTLFSLNADLPLTPASNTKLFSTAAALHYLGEDFRFSTFLFADGRIDQGVLQGDLILYGTGDPSISQRLLAGPDSVLGAMADSLAAAGVREITGDVVGDGSFFDAQWVGPGWLETDLDHGYGAPVGALAVAENIATIRFLPAAPGRRASIRTVPETWGIALDNRVVTVSNGANRVSFQRQNGTLIATGQVRAGTGGMTRTIPVVDPANFAAAGLRAALAERGIIVRGEVRSVRDRANSRVALNVAGASDSKAPRLIAVHHSRPLREITGVTNRVSQNLYAEAMLKSMGRVVSGEGSYAAGVDAVRRFLQTELGVDPVQVGLVDGSGLSRTNRISARLIVRLLDYMARSSVWEEYYTSLPEAGRSNGLEHRMRGTAAARRLRAKTGTVRHVSALSGYVVSADGERLAFSILANGVPSTARAKRTEDEIGARLASFSRGSPLAAHSATPADR